MANVKLKRIATSALASEAVEDGKIVWITDGNNDLYLDVGTTRKKMIATDTALSTTSTNPIQNQALTNSIINTTAGVSAITKDNIPCGTKPVKELITNLNDFGFTVGADGFPYATYKVGADSVTKKLGSAELLYSASMIAVSTVGGTVVTAYVSYTILTTAKFKILVNKQKKGTGTNILYKNGVSFVTSPTENVYAEYDLTAGDIIKYEVKATLGAGAIVAVAYMNILSA